MEGDGDYIVKLRKLVGKQKFFSQHPAQIFSYWGVSVVFEKVDGLAPVVGVVKKGIDPLHAAPAPKNLLCRVVLHIPEMGKGYIRIALQTKMLFMVIQRNTTNSTYFWEQQIEQQSPALYQPHQHDLCYLFPIVRKPLLLYQLHQVSPNRRTEPLS